MNLIQSIYYCLSTPTTISLIIAILILPKYIKRILTSSITCLPGPFYTSLSHIPIILHDQISNRTSWTLKLHAQYGPIIRLSPTEVSISSRDLIKEVFVSSSEGGGGYPKAPFFNIFQHFGARNAFSCIGSEDHSWRRRLVGGLYTKSAVLGKEVGMGRLWGLVGDFLEGVEREGVLVNSGVSEVMRKGRAVDLHSFCTYYATDAITSHIFPPGSSSTTLRGTKAHRSFVESSRESPDEVITYFKMEYERLESFYITVPNFLRRVARLVGLGTSGKSKERKGRTRLNVKGSGKEDNFKEGDVFYGGTEIEDWGFRRFLETKEMVEAGMHATVVAETLARNVVEGEKKKADDDRIELPIGDDRGLRLFEGGEKKYYRDDGAASECMDQFLAGMDTTGDQLSYIIHLLSLPTHHATQSTLRAEIRSLDLPKSYLQPLTQDQLTTIMKAPYLFAIIKETLRLYPASTTALQRSVPAGGRTLNSFFIPENTIIGATPMATNTSSIFASVIGSEEAQDINIWIPERWIPSIAKTQKEEESENQRLTEMKRRMWTFGSGGRGCIGKHLAMVEMKLLLAGIYGRYRTEIDDESEVLIRHNEWARRTSFMDVPYFPDAKGVVKFVEI